MFLPFISLGAFRHMALTGWDSRAVSTSNDIWMVGNVVSGAQWLGVYGDGDCTPVVFVSR